MDSIDYYDQNANVYYDRTIHRDMSEIMKPFIELLSENDEVLDLGCGSGRDTVSLEEAGFCVTALDGSKEMCKLAEIYTDKEVLNLTYDEMNFKEVFHGIWACGSLVHMDYKHMPELIEKLLEALKPGGVLYFSVREGSRNGWDGTRVFYDYTDEKLEGMLSMVPGKEVIRIWKTDTDAEDENTNPWFNVLLKKEEE